MTTAIQNIAEIRALPHDLDAERALLGAVILHNELYVVAQGIITPDDFFRVAHRIAWEAIAALAEQHAPIDLVALKNILIERNNLDTIGGVVYLAALIDGVPRSANVEYYSTLIREKARLRSLIFEAGKTIERAYTYDATADEIAADTQLALLKLSQGRPGDGFATMSQLHDRALDALERAVAHPGQITGVPTGYPDLDEMLCGLGPGDLIIIGGRPGMGKTALAMNMAENIGSTGRAVAIYSLEMGKDQLFQRALSSRARVNLQRIRGGHLGERDWAKLTHALGELHDMRLYIDDRAGITVNDIRATATKQAATEGLDVVVIDYLQLMRAVGRHQNRSLEVGSISRDLKELAKELQVPIIALSQLSRATEARSDHRPTLGDLRESGSLEQDADVVLFPYRPDMYRDGDAFDNARDDVEAEIIIAKQRNGPTGTVQVAYIKQFTRFENIDRGAPRLAQPA